MKLFVWDFHGVLEKGNEHAVVEVTNQVLEEFGVKNKLDLKLCQELYGARWSEYFKQMDPEADDERIAEMIQRGYDISDKGDAIERHMKPMDYAYEVLEKIEKAGHENLIISNTAPAFIGRFINAIDINKNIHHTIGADSHRKDFSVKNVKIACLKEFLKGKNYDELVAIGDMHSDIELGKSVGAKTYFFSLFRDGKDIDADYHITDLREVLKEV